MVVDQENINFLDLACMTKITPETTLENLGGTINSSFFDVANIAGTLKQKGVIDFNSAYGAPTSIALTETGKKFLADVDAKAAEPMDQLDDEILKQLSGGKRYPTELQSTLNLRARDLAFRLYKLSKQNLLAYELKNGNVELMLTEQGFLRAKQSSAMQAPKPQTQQPAAQPQQVKMQKPTIAQPMAGQPVTGQEMAGQQAMDGKKDVGQMPGEIKLHGKPHTKQIMLTVVLLIILAALVAHFYLHLF